MTSTLHASHGAKYARILAVGGFRGSRVVDNAEMCTYIESSDEWIRQRTGIAERRWVAEGETPRTMAVAAAEEALQRANLTANQISAVIVSTVSHFQQTPSMACLVADDLGCGAPAAFDISGACAGFCYGLAQAEALVRSGAGQYVLVIGVEALSLQTDLSDRSTAFLFSDGAGAVVVGPSDTPGIGPTVWGSDPSQSSVIETTSWKDQHHTGGDAPEGPFITMEGNKVFRWATTFIADKARETLRVSGLAPEDLDVFIPHQANNRITDSMLRHLKLPESVVVSRDIVQMGNSSAASIPLAMAALLESGQAQSGQTALLIGFGAGLVYAGQVVILP